MKIAILGGGSAGLGAAGYLSLRGHDVNLYNRTPEKIAPIVSSGNLKVSGVIEGVAKIRKVSSCVKDIVRDIDCVLVTARAFAHEPIVKSCLPYLEKNATIVIFTGYWAALRLQSLLSEYQRKDITIAETTLLPLASQVIGPGHVKISGVKSKMRIAAYPASKTLQVHKKLSSVFPLFFPGKSVLETGLESYNPALHVPIAFFNLGQLEKKVDMFKFYHDGISPKVAKVIDSVDLERMSLIREFDLDLMSAREMLLDYYETEGDSTYDVLRNCRAMEDYVLPNPFSYVQEDLLYGLVPMASICDLLGIPAETTKAFISSWSVVNSVDYWGEGIKVDKLGIDGMSSKEIVELVMKE